jgi:septal ring factor EnvC (AmiA/AmiB activator)
VLAAVPLVMVAAAVTLVPATVAQRPTVLAAATDTAEAVQLRRSLQAARAAAADASARAKDLQSRAAAATAAEDKARLELASVAALLQDAEASAGLAEARLAVIQGVRSRINRDLAARQEPLVELTAALQRVTARPLALSALQPASLRETVYLRAVLDGAVPAIRDRTRALRAQLARSRQLAEEARGAVQRVRQQEQAIGRRRTELLAMAARNRQLVAQASGAAQREAQRSADMALEARDLDELVGRFDQVAALRAQLAALPGPVMRPRGGATGAIAAPAQAVRSAAAPVQGPQRYQLPVIGRIVGGFGDAGPGGLPRTGLTLAPRPGALVVAPAAGRIAFAGPYRGFGTIIIVEHPGGWTSLLTGLATTDAQAGQQVAAGGPLGTAARRSPAISVELRRAGTPVDPLSFALREGG